MNEKMIARQHLLAEMELVKSMTKLTPEERRVEVRRHMYIELKAMEMKRRQTVALETLDKCKRDREEREKVTERTQKENMEKTRSRQEFLEKIKQSQLKKERLQRQKVTLVKEVASPTCGLSALKKEQERSLSSAELCHLTGDEADSESLPSDLKPADLNKKTLHNNWVEEKKTNSGPANENSATYLLFAAKSSPKCEEKTTKVNKTLQWMHNRLKVKHWVDKYQQHAEKEREKRTLKAEEQYANWTAFKNSHGSQCSLLYDCYTAGLAPHRNSILKACF